MNTLADHWDTYERRCIPLQAGAEQRHQLRMAFYAGAMGAVEIFTVARSHFSEHAVRAILSSLSEECLVVAQDSLRRAAGS